MAQDQYFWGELPAGYAKRADAAGNRMVVRQGRERDIGFDIFSRLTVEAVPTAYHGRGALTAVRLSDGETALVRQYRHGGVLRVLTRNWFFTWPARPFRELSITEELRRRGVPTVEIYAACVRRSYGPFYQGWLVSKEIGGAVDFWSALQQGYLQRFGRETVFRAVATSVGAMHREGVYHGDLNLKNILLRQEAAGVSSYLIDFDKSKLFLGRLPAMLVKKNLDRMLRSVRRLDPDGRYFSAADWTQWVRIYHDLNDR